MAGPSAGWHGRSCWSGAGSGDTSTRADGAIGDLLHWVMHGPDGSILDLYTSPPWDALCAEVGNLVWGCGRGRSWNCATP
jgi:hypothetical protein